MLFVGTNCLHSAGSVSATLPETKGLVINCGEGGGGYKMGKSWVHPPPLLFFKEWKHFASPLQYGLNLKLWCKNYPKTSGMTKTFSTPPFFVVVGVKLHMPPPPLLVISDQSPMR